MELHLRYAENQDQQQNQLLLQLKSCLVENEAVIDRVCILTSCSPGIPAEADRSQVLDKLREDLENKKFLIDQRFSRPVTMVVEFRSARTLKVGLDHHLRKPQTLTPPSSTRPRHGIGPDGENHDD